MNAMLRLLLQGYRYFVSPMLGATCRFHPSCSHYAEQALLMHGVLRGGWLTASRVCRCGPWSAGGHDPVPERVARP